MPLWLLRPSPYAPFSLGLIKSQPEIFNPNSLCSCSGRLLSFDTGQQWEDSATEDIERRQAGP